MTPAPSDRSNFYLKAALALAGTILLVTALPKAAHGYALEGPKWPNGSTPTLQLELGSPNHTLSDGNTSWNAAVSPVADMWNQVMGRIQLGPVNSSAAIIQGDHLNSLSFGSSFFGHSFGSNTLAVTSYSYSGTTMTEADIVFNTAWTWDSYRGSLRSAIDIQRVALHEVGHLIGLAHSGVANTIMYPSINNAYLLTADDIAGIQALYGSPSSTPTPTPSPTPSPTVSPTPTPNPSVTPTPTPNPTATPTPFPTATPTPTVSATPTPTPATVFVSLSVSPSSIHPGGVATFTVSTSTAPASDLTVGYRMSGTAYNGSNYSLSGTYAQITIPAGSKSATVTLTELAAARKTKTATMALNPGPGYILRRPTTATVSLMR